VRAGRDLELVVTHLEGLLAHGTNVIIESPKYILDKVTGQPREHDVVITYPGHHTVMVGIDCKDWAKAVDAPEVEMFSTKCRDTGISRGIMVSRSGFTGPAITKAAAHNISCLDLADAMAFDWLQAPGLALKRRMFSQTHLEPLIANPRYRRAASVGNVQIVDAAGNEVSHDKVVATISNAINQFRTTDEEIEGQTYSELIHLQLSPPWSILIKKRRKPVPVRAFDVKITYTLENTLIPFEKVQYERSESGEVISQTAYADYRSAQWQGRVSLMYKPGVGARAYFTPADPAQFDGKAGYFPPSDDATG